MNYVTERVVGNGSFGVVFQATCQESGEVVSTPSLALLSGGQRGVHQGLAVGGFGVGSQGLHACSRTATCCSIMSRGQEQASMHFVLAPLYCLFGQNRRSPAARLHS